MNYNHRTLTRPYYLLLAVPASQLEALVDSAVLLMTAVVFHKFQIF